MIYEKELQNTNQTEFIIENIKKNVISCILSEKVKIIPLTVRSIKKACDTSIYYIKMSHIFLIWKINSSWESFIKSLWLCSKSWFKSSGRCWCI